MRQLRHHDLGQMDGGVLLFGGPYSNAQALSALLAEARQRGIEPARMICTGDVVAYAGNPAEVSAQIRALGCGVVAGNCEIELATGGSNCGCGFEEGSTCDLLSVAWFNYAGQKLDIELKNWMGSLPDVLTFTHHDARYGVIHGGVSDVARFIWSSSAPEVFEEEWQRLEAVVGEVDHIIAGHSGIPFVRHTPRGDWINAGVIGMPAHDGSAQTRFAVLEQGKVQLERLDYDAEGAAAAMAAAGLPTPYARSLLTGYWPSEDVLPEDLRLPSFASG